ncbi:MAG: glycosyltransferase, partial [Myxococcota bacterium]|nr:glycosyltransferase [Myxococcota bacterium]
MTRSSRVLHLDAGPSFRGGQGQVLLLARGQVQDTSSPSMVVRVLARNHELLGRLEAAGVPCTAWAGPASPRGLFTLRQAIRDFRPDILHAHDSRALGAFRLLAPTELQTRTVVHRRIDDPPRRSRATRWKYSQARVISVSSAVDRAMADFGIPQQRRRVVYSAVDELPSRPPRRQPPEAGRPLRLLSIGALVPHKGHRHLLDALARTQRPHHLTLLGEGPLERTLQAQAQALHLQARLKIEQVPEDLNSSFAEADLFVHPSVTEGLGTAVLDAMARGLPVLASRCGGLPELVNSSSGWLVSPGKPDELREMLDWISSFA